MIILVIFLGLLAFLILGIFRDIVVFLYLEAKSYLYPYFFPEKHVAFLEKNFVYYQKLPKKSKKIFLHKVARFMSSKEFIPRQMTTVTDEMKVLISASAAQLTFGFRGITFPYFYKIFVFPDKFYNRINNAYHKGEVNPRLKSIALSWKDFVEGYLQEDGRNLGLHEMAHVLRLENRILNEEHSFLEEWVLQEWALHAQRTMIEINDGRETFFRKYGGTDREEFFAVAVENFFERPVEFNQKHPKTYRTLCRLLRQDPVLLEKA
ncbi:MAG: zinc-dependent peptidase [Ekhidna sp.]|uniref:zinc-dependent peptidase n=1 Tax=Ekhidna sp. TaxID=2608089 RepID=UPI0032EEDAC9